MFVCALRPLLRLVAVVSSLLLGCVVVPAPRAEAHPFGDPSVAEVALSAPDTVRVTWRFGMSDDLTHLALWLDLLPAERVMLDGAVFFEPADQQLLATAPAFTDYLLEHVAVTTSAGDCSGSVVDIADLVDAGATLDFTCPDVVSEARVDLAVLTDMNPAYTTMASGPAGQKQVYDGEQPSHAWALGSVDGGAPTSPELGRSAVLQVGGVLGTVAVGGLLGGLLWYRRGRDASFPGARPRSDRGVR